MLMIKKAEEKLKKKEKRKREKETRIEERERGFILMYKLQLLCTSTSYLVLCRY